MQKMGKLGLATPDQKFYSKWKKGEKRLLIAIFSYQWKHFLNVQELP
jgi:hypothetical protein